MKKTIFLGLTVIFMSAILCVSCSKEEAEMEDGTGTGGEPPTIKINEIGNDTLSIRPL